MDDGANGETVLPDLRDIEVKIGRKIPEGLIKCMRDEASSMKGHEIAAADRDAGKKGLDEKIRKLKIDMAFLRSLDVNILQQLLALHEGMEAVRWLAEERSTLNSRCSSLTSSQYSLGEGPDTSWRGSWSSLHDPNDKLDNISIGSYLDTLADDMDEYGPTSSESVLCSPTAARPPGPDVAPAGGRTGSLAPSAVEGAGGCAGTSAGTGPLTANVPDGHPAGTGAGSVAEATAVAAAGAAKGGSRSIATGKKAAAAGQAKEGPKGEAAIWTKTKELGKKDPVSKDNGQARPVKNMGTLEEPAKKTSGSDPIQPCLSDKLGKSDSPKFKAYTNGKKDLDTCKMNGKMHLEYDAHWRWVQSQDDVTFL
ncbi:unnamed protein product [Arctogadus glacialis]